MGLIGEWSLYKHTSPSGKVYIGITKNISERWRMNGKRYKGSTRIWNAIQKYGWNNFKHEIIMDGLSKQEASQLEKEYIAKYNSTNPLFGYNLTYGGYDGILCVDSAEQKRKSLMGHEVSADVRKALSDFHSIEVICLETSKVFRNAKEAGEAMGIYAGSIGKCCNGVASNAGGFHFAKLIDFQRGTVPVFISKPKGKRIVCIETGKEYKSQSAAAKEYGVSSQAISHCCSGKVETSAGLHWKFVDGDDYDQRN